MTKDEWYAHLKFVEEFNYNSYTTGEFYYKEFLNTSIEASYLIADLKEYIYDWQYNKYVDVFYNNEDQKVSNLLLNKNNEDVISIHIRNSNDRMISKFLEVILSRVKAYGWYTAKIEKDEDEQNVDDFIDNLKGVQFNLVKFYCEKRYPIEGSFLINQEIYHLTNQSKLKSKETDIKKNSILDLGFCPKNPGLKISYHPKRIYFCLNIKCIFNFINELRKKKFFNPPYALLSINPAKIFYDTFDGSKEQIYFFNDPRKQESIYTNFNIKPEYIDVLQENIMSEKDIKIS